MVDEAKPPAPAPETPSRGRARWKKILIVAGSALAGLILLVLLLGPAVVESVVESRIERALSRRLRSDVTVGEVSFSWSGRLTVTDLRIQPRGYPASLLDVKRAEARIALGAALTGSYRGEVEILSPRLVVEKNGEGRFNYDFPPAPPQEEERGGRGPEERPAVEMTFKIRDGEVIVKGGGKDTTFRNLALDARIDGLEKPITYALSLENPTHGKLSLTGAYDLERRAGPLHLKLDRLSLKNLTGLAQAYGPVREMDGTLDGRFDLELSGLPRFSGGGRLEASKVVLGTRDSALHLDRLTLTHEGTADAAGRGRHTVKVESGPALDLLVTAQTEGPSVTAALQGRSDLAALGEALRDLMNLKAGTRLEGVALLKGEAEVRGADLARWDLEAAVTGLGAVDAAGKRVEIDRSVTLRSAGAWEGKTSTVTVRSLKLESSFACADVKAEFTTGKEPSLRPSSLLVRADLARLGAKLASFMEDPPELAGTARLEGKYADDRYDVTGSVEGLKVATKGDGGPSTTGPIDATLVQRGTFRRDLLKVEEGLLKSNAVEIEARGEVRSVLDEGREGGLTFDVRVRPAELSKWKRDLTLGGPDVRGSVSVEFKRDQVRVAAGTRLEGLTWTDARTGEAATIRTEAVESSLVWTGNGAVTRLKTALVEWKEMAYLARGSLEGELSFGETGAKGVLRIADLDVRNGKRSFRDPAVVLEVELAVSPAASEIRKAELRSTFLSGGITGVIRNAGREKEFAGVRGRFTYVPGGLGAALAPWLPGSLEGEGERAVELTLEGKVRELSTLAILRGARGTFDADLARFTSDGLTLSGRTRLELNGGRVFSTLPLEVNRGRSDLNLVVDFRPPPESPRSVIEISAKGVDANADMKVLERINPIFHTTHGKVEGKIGADFKLSWEGPVELGETNWVAAAGRRLRGEGKFSMEDLSVAGSPTVGQIMAAFGEENVIRGRLLAADIRVLDGRCEYQDMTLRLARYELRFSGWVEFEPPKDPKGDQMELLVEMPITDSLMKKHPNLQKYIGKTFFVPLRGTVAKPRLDVERAVAELLKRSLEGVLEEKARDLLNDLFNRKKRK